MTTYFTLLQHILNQKEHSNMPLYPSLSLSDLPLRPSTLTLLQQRGFVTLAELMESKALGLATLAAELQLNSAQVMRLLQEIQDCLTASSVTSGDGAVRGPQEVPLSGPSSDPSPPPPTNENDNYANVPQLLVKPPPMMTASDILSKASTEKGGIITFCKSLDQLLHRSGIPIGSLTEIAGLPGLGKTQFAMQLAVNARLPTSLGGVQGQTLYVDTEGSVAPERLQTMAEALLQHCQHTLRKRGGQELPVDFTTPSQILQDIHVFRVLDEAAQTATLYSLPYWIEQLSNTSTPVKLIVVDSIAFHYRCSSGSSRQDYQERTRALTQLAAFLNDVARDYKVAVVCLNQMTTKLVDGQSRLVPALGESWAHAVTTRLLLSYDDDDDNNNNNSSSGRSRSDHTRRCCRLVKSPCMPSGTAYYQVKAVGIRDAEPPTRRIRHDRDDEGDQDATVEHPTSRTDRILSGDQYKRPRTN